MAKKTQSKGPRARKAERSGGSAVPLTAASAGARALPDWAPWAAIGALGALGAVGAMLLAPHGSAKAGSVVAPAATTVVADAPARPAASAGKTVSVQYLVVSHRNSPLGRHQKLTRSKDEAKARAEEALARAKKGEDFAQLITQYSDDPGVGGKQGVLENFQRSEAIPTFGDAAFALQVGGLSGVVETPYGFDIIRRTK